MKNEPVEIKWQVTILICPSWRIEKLETTFTDFFLRTELVYDETDKYFDEKFAFRCVMFKILYIRMSAGYKLFILRPT